MSIQQISQGLRSNKWAGLIAASSGLYLGSLDITVNVALPDITSYFAVDVSTIQWIIIFYVGSTTGLQLSLGSAADKYGLKKFFIIGIATYTLAVLLISLAPSLSTVIGLRVLQAVGNGLMLASAPALVTSAFPAEHRGRALGIMAGLGTLGMITGALGGGLLVDALGWRAIFWARVPLGVVGVMFAFLAVNPGDRNETGRHFDFAGAVTLFIGLASLILFATLGGRIGWIRPGVLALLVLAVASLAAFVRLESSTDSPVLDLRLVRDRVISLSVASGFLMFFATFVNLFILPFFVADVMGVTATVLGVLLMLTPIASAGASPLGGWLSDRIPPAYVSTFALVVAAGSMYWMSTLDGSATVPEVAVRMVAVGVGLGFFQASSATLVMSRVPRHRLGTGGAILSLSRSIGVVSSVALMSAYFASRLDFHGLSSATQGIPVNLTEASIFVSAFKDTYLVSTIVASSAAAISILYWPRFVRSRLAE